MRFSDKAKTTTSTSSIRKESALRQILLDSFLLIGRYHQDEFPVGGGRSKKPGNCLRKKFQELLIAYRLERTIDWISFSLQAKLSLKGGIFFTRFMAETRSYRYRHRPPCPEYSQHPISGREQSRKSYNHDYDEYVYVRENGDRYRVDWSRLASTSS